MKLDDKTFTFLKNPLFNIKRQLHEEKENHCNSNSTTVKPFSMNQ